MNKKLLFCGMVVLSLALATGCGCSKKEEKKEKEEKITVVSEEDVIKDQVVDGIELKNTSLVVTNGISQLITEATNNGASDYELIEFTIIVKDASDNVIATMPGYVGETIKAGETRQINSSIDIDLSNAKKVEYEVKK